MAILSSLRKLTNMVLLKKKKKRKEEKKERERELDIEGIITIFRSYFSFPLNVDCTKDFR